MKTYININKKSHLILISSFIISFVVMVLRRPDLVSNAQFWAEDGHVWFSMAYNQGPFESLIYPQNGYYQTISKIIAAIAVNINILYAPLFFNLSAIAVRSLLVVLILSNRFRSIKIIPRLFISLFIILMPEVAEVHANVTNNHWYLSLYLLLVIISEKPASTFGKVHDIASVMICGMSGPFIVFMAPMVGLNILTQRRLSFKKITPLEFTFIAVCLIQFLAIIFTSSGTRVSMELGANLLTLSKILTTKIFLGLWANGDFLSPLWNSEYICALISITCLSITAFVFAVSNYAMRSAIIFGCLTVGFSLAKPMLSAVSDQWPLMIHGGGRYSIIPTVIWCAVFTFFVNYIFRRKYRAVTFVFYASSLISCSYFFYFQPLPDYNWQAQVNNFQNAPIGSEFTFKFNPGGWTMTLIKK